MIDYKKLVKSVYHALSRTPVHTLCSLAPKEGERYRCSNCERFDFESDGCFTEWMGQYGYKQQKDMCPGYKPPKNGNFVLTISDPIDV